jgi:hypothetical protein
MALVGKREKAERRVEQLEAEQRDAVQAREAARAALIEFERKGGGRRAERSELEAALNDAEATAAERWPERTEGARRALRMRNSRFSCPPPSISTELVANVQRDAALAAETVTKAAQSLVDAYRRREPFAGEIAQLVSAAGIRIRPGDITFSKADQVARAAADLIANGGEEPPRLRRDPRQPIPGAPAVAA